MTDTEETAPDQLALWRDCYPDAWDGDETPDDLASEFFNRRAEVDFAGEIWLVGGEGGYADRDQKDRFLAWLEDNGHYMPI